MWECMLRSMSSRIGRMKSATAQDLRRKTAALLEDVRRGQKIVITHRGKSVAVLSPAETFDEKVFTPIGFGIWHDHGGTRKVNALMAKLRTSRFKG